MAGVDDGGDCGSGARVAFGGGTTDEKYVGRREDVDVELWGRNDVPVPGNRGVIPNASMLFAMLKDKSVVF